MINFPSIFRPDFPSFVALCSVPPFPSPPCPPHFSPGPVSLLTSARESPSARTAAVSSSQQQFAVSTVSSGSASTSPASRPPSAVPSPRAASSDSVQLCELFPFYYLFAKWRWVAATIVYCSHCVV